jgi:N-carbamoylputrescine amidase
MRCVAEPATNMAHAIDLVREAAAQGARIVCLPELFRSEYFCQTHDINHFDLAEPIPGPSTDALSKLAAELKITIEASLFERRAAGLYHNTSVILLPDGTMTGLYRKSHIPHDPLFYEKYYFTPGDTGFLSSATPEAQVGVLICWDQWYPEAARATALTGAQILVYPTAIGWHPAEKAEYGEAQYSAWQTMQRAHAIANGIFVVSINRVGHEGAPTGGIEFWGGSFVADPFGRILAQAPHDEEAVVVVDCDLGLIEDTRRNWPFLRDRRIDLFQPLTQRYMS